MDKAHKTARIRLKRIAPGIYETPDGKYEVHGWQRPQADGYGPAGQWNWYWRATDGEAHDLYATKREAVEALQAKVDGL